MAGLDSNDYVFSSWFEDPHSLDQHRYSSTEKYFDSDSSPSSSTVHTPEGVYPAPLPVLVDTYPFEGSFGVSPQALHAPFVKPSFHRSLKLGDYSDEDADGDNESDDAGSVYKDSDDEDNYNEDYNDFVKSRGPKPPLSNLRSLPFASMPSTSLTSSLKRRRSSISNPFDDTYDERPAKRVARTLPSSPTQIKPATPVHAKSSSPVPAPHRPARKIRNAPPPRNIQAPVNIGTTVEDLQPLNFRCPVAGCGYRSVGKRIPDFKRHLKTHEAVRTVVCTGVRFSEADRYPIDERHAVPYVIEKDGEELYIGGCMQSFSRSDALMRHVNNRNAKCVHEKQKNPRK